MKRLLIRLRARVRVIRAWLAERHAAMAALGSQSSLEYGEWIGADATVVCRDQFLHVARMHALRVAERNTNRAVRRAQQIGALRA